MMPGVRRLVTVVIPCHNQAGFLEEAVRSAQSAHCDVEVVVVDDGSTDGTPEVMARLPGVHGIRQSNAGVAAARNRGLAAARGEYVVFLDSDDRLLPGGIDSGAAALDARASCAMAFGRCVMMAADGTILPTPTQARIEREHHAAFLRNNPVWMPAMAIFRREPLQRLGGFTPGFEAACDYDLYLRASREYPVYDHGELVAAYRRHGTNMSGNAARMLRETRAVMRRHRPVRRSAEAVAWQEGCRHWRAFYGTHLVEEIRQHYRDADWLACWRKGLILAGHDPARVGRELLRAARTRQR